MVRIIVRLSIVLLLGLALPVAWADKSLPPALAAGHKIFVEKAEKDADVAMIKELKDWGRWPIVADESRWN